MTTTPVIGYTSPQVSGGLVIDAKTRLTTKQPLQRAPVHQRTYLLSLEGANRYLYCRENGGIIYLYPREDLNPFRGGFDWGYWSPVSRENGPIRMTALTLLADLVGDIKALQLYRLFAKTTIADLRHEESYELDYITIQNAVAWCRRKDAARREEMEAMHA